MKRHGFTLLLAGCLAALLTLGGCNSTRALLPSVSGKAGEIIVVMEKPDWEDALGNDVRELLAHDCPWLAQKEPLYSLVNVVPSAFADLFKVHRNIMLFIVNPQVDSAGIIYKHDMWAQPQCVIQISAPSSAQASEILKEKGPMIVSSIEQAERDRVIRNTLRYEESSLYRSMSELFGGAPHFPTGYKLRKATDDFAWIADDKEGVYQDVLIYRYPVEDDPFQLDKILAHRNEVMKENVPGMFDGTYMTTSEFFPPTLEYLKYRGRDLVQTRGMWEVQNDFMGGPFVSHSFYSPDGSEIIVAEAFVYAPRFDKRQYLRQVESILYSWEWKESANEKENGEK
ncbi:MAG: DUF4837 family protein [Bacteroidales bacterium]|nr:DUF4837 family protein [Bacteroidales bacterium]